MRHALAVCALAAATALAAANVVDAQIPEPKNSRSGPVRSVDYREGQIITLPVVTGYPATVRLESGEKVETVTLSDTTAWQVTTNRAGNRLTIVAVQDQGDANLLVRTTRRLYTFGLTAQPASRADRPSTSVRLRPASSAIVASSPRAGAAADASYRVRGDLALRPSAVSDDGVRTYIDWPPDTSLPAVYAINDAGREALVNGNMRDGRYVIDCVEKHLVFRIDKRVASAVRVIRGRTER